METRRPEVDQGVVSLGFSMLFPANSVGFCTSGQFPANQCSFKHVGLQEWLTSNDPRAGSPEVTESLTLTASSLGMNEKKDRVGLVSSING